jgi:PfaB family protein
VTTRRTIAIVGLGCVFPDAPNAASFWKLVRQARSVATDPPVGRWPGTPESLAQTQLQPDRLISTKACFVDPSPPFESSKLADMGLNQLDPLFHLLLHAGHQAWDDAQTRHLDRTKAGIVLGHIVLPSETISKWSDDLLHRSMEAAWGKNDDVDAPPFNPLNRYVAGLPGGLLAASLGLRGGAYTLDAACASSLYAIKLAADELAEGRRDVMLAGGLSRPDSLYTQMGFTHLHALSPTGTCRPFSQNADGLLVGEGAGMVVLKRLEDAIRDGDHIYATIEGVGLSNDIGGNLMHPDSEGQLRAMRQAYDRAGWQPEDVDLIECHGTGTPAGDKVELASLNTLWKDIPGSYRRCVIGSVKSNIGHLLTAAGIAGLIKTLMAMKAGELPPTAGDGNVRPELTSDRSHFRMLERPEPWDRREQKTPRRAAISAFGFGGINAHVLLEEWTSSRAQQLDAESNDESPSQVDEPVAIVGLAGQYGQWTGPQSLTERMLGFDDPTHTPHRIGAADGYPLQPFELDRLKFRIPPRELEQLLPQQALMLQTASDAMDDAGVETHIEKHVETGVFIGISLDLNTTNFHARWSAEQQVDAWDRRFDLNLSAENRTRMVEELRQAAGPYLNADRTMGALGGIVASRVARWIGAGASSFTISCEENSGLKAVEVALRSLRRGEIEMALVGGVDLNADPRSLLAQSMLANENDIASFGEGAGALVLKRLSDAQRDGDRIYCLLKGAGHASGDLDDGSGRTLDADAYGQSFSEALTDAAVDAATIGLIDVADRSGREGPTPEMNWLAESLHDKRRRHRCALSHSRDLVGHTGAACGIAGVQRAALCLHHHVQPATPRLGNSAPARTTETTYDPSDSHYWLRNRQDGPRRAIVCGRSVDGSTTHAVLEGVEPEGTLPPTPPGSSALVAIRGADQDDLLKGLVECRAMMGQSHRSITAWADAWHQSTDQHGPAVVILVATDMEHLSSLLSGAEQCVSNNSRSSTAGLFFEPNPLHHPGRLAFVFPGSGNHYTGMTRQLSLRAAGLLNRADQENDRLLDQFGDGVFWQDTTLDENDHRRLIFGQVWAGTFVHDIFRQIGIHPNAVIGYSLGETAGLFATGAWSDRDGMLKRIRSSELFTSKLGAGFEAVRETWNLGTNEPVDWQMGVLKQPREAVEQAIASHANEGRLYLLIVNGPSECVVGGDGRSLQQLAEYLDSSIHLISGVTTVHCDVARPVADAYRKLHLFETSPEPDVIYYSCHLGQSYTVNRASAADSILGMALEPFDYSALIQNAYDDGIRLFVEMGPGASCSRMIGHILKDRPHVARSACALNGDEHPMLLETLATILAHGVDADLAGWSQDIAVPDLRKPSGQSLTMTPRREVPEPLTLPRPVRPKPNPTSPATAESPTTSPAAPQQASTEARWIEPIVAGMVEALEARHKTHEQFLQLQSRIEHSIHQAASLQLSSGSVPHGVPTVAAPPLTPPPKPRSDALFDREACLQFAVGNIENVLGPSYAEADRFSPRVRLPDEPLMLVDRITELDAEPHSLSSGRIVTEHDVLPGAWYLDADRIPTCIAVEAGQADLFLSAYLGIDAITKGEAVYRLLDASITFHAPLPSPGQTIRYDIRIIRFFKLGRTHLFQFEFDATVDGQLVLTMRDGSAGFFSERELADGRGIVDQTELLARPTASDGPAKNVWLTPPPTTDESYDDPQLDALRSGTLSSCFGPSFGGLLLRQPETLPGGRMRLVHRILSLQAPTEDAPGKITGEADIHPDDWFLICHFMDDQVMPGTLMYECCLHTLRVYLMRMGWIGERGQVHYHPLQGQTGQLKCRGQVTATTRQVQYEITIKETAYLDDGTPYVVADAMMLADHHPIVEMKDLSLSLDGLTQIQVEAMWSSSTTSSTPQAIPPLFDQQSILDYAQGHPSDAFGDKYKPFNHNRILARLPRPPYLFMDQVERIEDCQPWTLKSGGRIESSYTIPSDAWYFTADRQESMSLAILVEIALQPCGWFAAYLGSALTSETDLSFRNLDGNATLVRPITSVSGVLRAFTQINSVSTSGGMIIQSYSCDLHDADGSLFTCDTVFGFFSKAALNQQIGLREATWHTADDASTPIAFPSQAPLPDTAFRMVDTVSKLSLSGGRHGQGWVEGDADVDPGAWFFRAHFYQDPVIPGSLGLEAMVQLLKAYAMERWPRLQATGQPITMFQSPAPGVAMQWKYRGQVVPTNDRVSVQIHVKSADDRTGVLVADGLLAVDGRVIYEFNNMSLQVT